MAHATAQQNGATTPVQSGPSRGPGGPNMSDNRDTEGSFGGRTVLPNGAEIHFTDDRDSHAPDRVEILAGGMVKCIYKNQYELKIFPPHKIDGIHTYTKHLEDKEWW